MRWSFYKTDYSSNERHQLKKITAQFSANGLTVPNHLILKSSAQPTASRQPINAPSMNQQRYDYSHWVGQVAPHCAHESISLAISSLCTYQTRRSQRWNVFRRGYCDDPTNQLCEYLKEWLVNLSTRRIDPTLLQDIERHIQLVQSLASPEIFPPGRFATRTTMSAMLGRVQHVLADIKDSAHRVYAEKSLSEYCQQLSFMTTHITTHAESYLYYVYLINKVSNDDGGFSPSRFLTDSRFSLRDKTRDTAFRGLLLSHHQYTDISLPKPKSYCTQLLERRLRPLTLLDNDSACQQCEQRDLEARYSNLMESLHMVIKYGNVFSAIASLMRGQEIPFAQFGFECLITVCEGYQAGIVQLQDCLKQLQRWSSLHLSHAYHTTSTEQYHAWQDNRKQCHAAFSAIASQLPATEGVIKALSASLHRQQQYQSPLSPEESKQCEATQHRLQAVVDEHALKLNSSTRCLR